MGEKGLRAYYILKRLIILKFIVQVIPENNLELFIHFM